MVHRSALGSLVGLIDPAIDNDINLGDHIISEAVRHTLTTRCGFRNIVRVPSIWKLRRIHYHSLKECNLIFVGGTNLLSSNMNVYNQWKINLLDTLFLGKVILLGVGWWQYQPRPNLYSRFLLRRVLHKYKYHSVRDTYTQMQLRSMGVHNVWNTCCPTTWGITTEHQNGISSHRSSDVVFTLTCYNVKPDQDRQVLKLLSQNYRNVYFWPQGNEDREYAESLCSNLIHIPRSVAAFDQFLDEHDDVDYIGTRLHAGIRAIQKGKRSLILMFDNRAEEISRDINLQVVERSDPTAIERWINSDSTTDIRLPLQEINTWVQQFQDGPGV